MSFLLIFDLSSSFFSRSEILSLRCVSKEVKELVSSRYKANLGKKKSFLQKCRELNPKEDWILIKSYYPSFRLQHNHIGSHRLYLKWKQPLQPIFPVSLWPKWLRFLPEMISFDWIQWFKKDMKICPLFCTNCEDEIWNPSCILKILKFESEEDQLGIGISTHPNKKDSFIGMDPFSIGYHLDDGMICHDGYVFKRVSKASIGDEIKISIDYCKGKLKIEKNDHILHEQTLCGQFLKKPLYFLVTGILEFSYDLNIKIGTKKENEIKC